jgi:hypothetical protein
VSVPPAAGPADRVAKRRSRRVQRRSRRVQRRSRRVDGWTGPAMAMPHPRRMVLTQGAAAILDPARIGFG